MKNKVPKQFDLTIVVPAYCEERRIGRTLDELAKFLNTDTFFSKKGVEVLVVAADSPDKTKQLVKNRVSKFENLTLLEPGSKVGKGRDVKFGMDHAKGTLAVFMDADLATPLCHLKDFYTACSKDADMVIATRNLLEYRKNKIRNIFSYAGNGVYKLVSGSKISDTQCGFKMFNKKARKICFSKMTILGWDFDMELIAIAGKNNLKIMPIQVDDWQDMPFSTYNEKVLGIGYRMAKHLTKIFYYSHTGRYN